MCGRDQTRPLRFSPKKTIPYLAEAPFAQRALHDRADHQAYHFLEETVALELDQGNRRRPLESDPANCAGRGGHRVTSIRREAGKVVRAGKELGAGAQGAVVESTGHMPGAPELERRKHRRGSETVTVDFSTARKTGMKSPRDESAMQDANLWRERCVHGGREDRRIQPCRG